MEFNLLPEKKPAKSAHYAISLTSTPPGRPVSRSWSAGPSPLSSSFSLTSSHNWSDQRQKESIWSKSDLNPPFWPSDLLKQRKKSIQSKETLSLLTPAVAQSSRVYTVCAWLTCVCVLIWSISSHWACNNFAPSLVGSILNSSCCCCCVSRPEKRTIEKI